MDNLIAVLRKVDRYIGVPLLNLLASIRRKQSCEKRQIKRVLLIKLFGIGNLVLLSPVFKSIRKIFPEASIEVLSFKQNLAIANAYPQYIDRTHGIGFGVKGLLADIPKFIAGNRGKYDMIIDFEQFVRLSALIGLLLNPKLLVGIPTANSKKSRAFDCKLDYKEDKHVAEEYYALAKLLARKFSAQNVIDRKAELVKPETKRTEKTNKILSKLKGKFSIGACIGGRQSDKDKRYPQERFAEVFNRILAKNKDVEIIFFGSNSEKGIVDKTMRQLGCADRCINLAGELTLQESAELISKMKIFVSNDTGPIHLAAALGVWCVGIYGPTSELIYGPYTKKKTILRFPKKPIMSSHNEKDAGWPNDWWPAAEEVFAKTQKLITALRRKGAAK